MVIKWRRPKKKTTRNEKTKNYKIKLKKIPEENEKRKKVNKDERKSQRE